MSPGSPVCTCWHADAFCIHLVHHSNSCIMTLTSHMLLGLGIFHWNFTSYESNRWPTLARMMPLWMLFALVTSTRTRCKCIYLLSSDCSACTSNPGIASYFWRRKRFEFNHVNKDVMHKTALHLKWLLHSLHYKWNRLSTFSVAPHTWHALLCDMIQAACAKCCWRSCVAKLVVASYFTDSTELWLCKDASSILISATIHCTLHLISSLVAGVVYLRTPNTHISTTQVLWERWRPSIIRNCCRVKWLLMSLEPARRESHAVQLTKNTSSCCAMPSLKFSSILSMEFVMQRHRRRQALRLVVARNLTLQSIAYLW